jgi:hypothetical protein
MVKQLAMGFALALAVGGCAHSNKSSTASSEPQASGEANRGSDSSAQPGGSSLGIGNSPSSSGSMSGSGTGSSTTSPSDTGSAMGNSSSLGSGSSTSVGSPYDQGSGSADRSGTSAMGGSASSGSPSSSDDPGASRRHQMLFGAGEKYELSGKVANVNVDRGEITIAREMLPPALLKVESQTKLQVDGQQATLNDLKYGADVRASFNLSGRRPIALEIDAKAGSSASPSEPLLPSVSPSVSPSPSPSPSR